MPTKNKPVQETQVIEEKSITIPSPIDLDKPEQDTKFAQASAILLVDIIKKNNWSRKLGGQSEHIQYEGWQTVGKYYGYAVKTFDAEYVEYGGTWGFKAKAVVVNEHTGIQVGGAEALCMNDEYNWKNKPKFQLASMAQTRAGSKALRQILGFVVALAGYNPTPAEEMDEVGRKPLPTSPSPVEDKPKESILPITVDQKGQLMVLLPKLGKTQVDLNRLVMTQYKLGSYQLLTVTQADLVIKFLEKKLAEKDAQELDNGAVGNLTSPDLTEDELDDIAKELDQEMLDK